MTSAIKLRKRLVVPCAGRTFQHTGGAWRAWGVSVCLECSEMFGVYSALETVVLAFEAETWPDVALQ